MAALIGERHRQALAEDGVVRLPGLLPAERVEAARYAILCALAREGQWRDGAGRLPLEGDERPRGSRKLARRLARTKVVADVLQAPALHDAVAALLAGPVRTLTDTLNLLLTLPNATAWTVPHNVWHLDLPRLPRPGLPGVQAFAFLDAVPPEGGGTLVIRGSHRLLNDRGFVRSRNVKRLLKREPWFAALTSRDETDRRRFLAPAEVHGVPVQVVELHGQPGDVVLTDLRLLHTIAPNAGNAPRLMATQRYLRAEAADAFFGLYGADGADARREACTAAAPLGKAVAAANSVPCNA